MSWRDFSLVICVWDSKCLLCLNVLRNFSAMISLSRFSLSLVFISAPTSTQWILSLSTCWHSAWFYLLMTLSIVIFTPTPLSYSHAFVTFLNLNFLLAFLFMLLTSSLVFLIISSMADFLLWVLNWFLYFIPLLVYNSFDITDRF